MRIGLTLAFGCLLGGVAVAGPPAPARSARGSSVPARLDDASTPEAAAQAALAALESGDAAALAALARRDAPDPWRVADQLLAEGRPEAAAAFANASRRSDVEALARWVESRRGAPEDVDAREALAAVRAALEDGRARDALEASPRSSSPGVTGVRLSMARGEALVSLDRGADAVAAWLAAATQAEGIGWLAAAADALERAALVANAGPAPDVAAVALTRLRELAIRRGDAVGAVRALGDLGALHAASGRFADALASDELARAELAALGDRAGAAAVLGCIGDVYGAIGAYPRAIDAYERAGVEFERLGDAAAAATMQLRVGKVHDAAGDSVKALASCERAIARMEAAGDAAGAAAERRRVGEVYGPLGRTREPTSRDRSLPVEGVLRGRLGGGSSTLELTGRVHCALGDCPEALAIFERAYRAQTSLGDRAGAAGTLGEIGAIEHAMGDFARARSTYERARGAREALADRAGAAAAAAGIGRVHESEGDWAAALAAYRGALAEQEAAGDRTGATRTLGSIGRVHEARGEHAEAIAAERAAVESAASLARGLASDEGAGARAGLSFIYEVGARAAVEAGRADELTYFLESGRARSLVEGLASREAIRSTLVPVSLVDEEARSRAEETAASRRLAAAVASGELAAIRARQAELDSARIAVGNVTDRIERASKARTAPVVARVSTLDELRAALEPGDEAVLYGLFERDAIALVATRSAAHVVMLGPTSAIDDAVARLDPGNAREDPSAALAALDRLVVAPLRLDPATTRVLVSPSGSLVHVPFAALRPGLAFVGIPSGTTYGLLRDARRARGEGVLALGDPVYGDSAGPAPASGAGEGSRLVPLPGSRTEAREVGTVALLGFDATEARLAEALAGRGRWRAVHLACHGLVDPARPERSSLALTPSGSDDGRLTADEVARLSIPADLVVLSACESGRGRNVQGEGLVGLATAFLRAGAPRVIGSLWKVDDDATRALMTKFYELWNPRDGGGGLPTAQALCLAQEHVRTKSRWAHPYYWAAWVLVGLPD